MISLSSLLSSWNVQNRRLKYSPASYNPTDLMTHVQAVMPAPVRCDSQPRLCLDVISNCSFSKSLREDAAPMQSRAVPRGASRAFLHMQSQSGLGTRLRKSKVDQLRQGCLCTRFICQCENALHVVVVHKLHQGRVACELVLQI